MNSVCRRMLGVDDGTAISDFPATRGRSFDPLEELQQELIAARRERSGAAMVGAGRGFGASNITGTSARRRPGRHGRSHGRRRGAPRSASASTRIRRPTSCMGCVNDSREWEALVPVDGVHRVDPEEWRGDANGDHQCARAACQPDEGRRHLPFPVRWTRHPVSRRHGRRARRQGRGALPGRHDDQRFHSRRRHQDDSQSRAAGGARGRVHRLLPLRHDRPDDPRDRAPGGSRQPRRGRSIRRRKWSTSTGGRGARGRATVSPVPARRAVRGLPRRRSGVRDRRPRRLHEGRRADHQAARRRSDEHRAAAAHPGRFGAGARQHPKIDCDPSAEPRVFLQP